MPRSSTVAITADPVVSSSFKLPQSLHKSLKIAAIHEGRDMSRLLEDAVRAYLAKGTGAKSATR